MIALKLPRLLRTTAVRLALRYALIYTLMVGLSLGALLWFGSGRLDSQPERRLEQDLRALIVAYQHDGAEGLVTALARAEQTGGGELRLTLWVSADGAKRAGNLLGWPDRTAARGDGRAYHQWIAEEFIRKGRYADDAYVAAVSWQLADGSRLLLAQRDPEAEALLNITEYLTEVLSVAVIMALVMSVVLGHRILRRMDAIGSTASEIMAGDLSRRVPVSARDDEFDTLAQRLNAMLERIQRLIKGMREVTDNVAHDLRSPLTRMRNHLEVTLLETRDDSEYRQAIAQGIEDADGVIKTFNTLLGIARAEAGSLRTGVDIVDLAALTQDLAELYAPLAEERGQTLKLEINAPTTVAGNRDLLAQALGNLLDNAIKYAPAGSVIVLKAGRHDSSIEITVTDRGPGVPESERQRVLERFVRLESSRHLPGNGLGLALVAAVARLHQVELVFADAQPGLMVTLRFPRSPTSVGRAVP